MNIKIIDKNGVTLKTKGKYCTEDISVAVDESLTGITPTGTYQVTNNGEYDITEYAKVNVNVASSGGGDTTQEDALVTRKLTTYSNNRVTEVGASAFYGYTALKNVDLPQVTIIGASAFYKCSNLESIYLPLATEIAGGGCGNCNSLKAVIITQEESVCVLAHTSVFLYCYHILGTINSMYNPGGAKDGYIYVPDSLVESYKSATNWSTYADQIKPLSELPQEYKDLYNIA